MRFFVVPKNRLLLKFGVIVFLFSYCAKEQNSIPVTTSSKQALQYFLQGQELMDKFRRNEARDYFIKAIQLDSSFALAYLNLAFTYTTAAKLFKNLQKSVSLVDQVSEAERYIILSAEAGINGQFMKQRSYYQRLVRSYPEDARSYYLFGSYLFRQQEYEEAINVFQNAIEINPEFSPLYNLLGYCYRSLGDFEKAKKAFQIYIDLLPDDPNPYDSYGELLLKMGEYDLSIKNYQKALSIHSMFVPSHVGIAANLNLKGKHNEARRLLSSLFNNTNDPGTKRTALISTVISFVDEGNLLQALRQMEQVLELDAEMNDQLQLTGDIFIKAAILIEMEQYSLALRLFREGKQFVNKSELSQDIKNNTEINLLFQEARIAVKQKQLQLAREKIQLYLTRVKSLQNRFLTDRGHYLEGIIALENKEYEKAVEQFSMSNQENPIVLYKMTLAYLGMGNRTKAKEYCLKTVNFNAINSLNYAFVRKKAYDLLFTL